MIVNPQIPLHRLVLSLSEALDSIHPNVVDHQQRVAYIATAMARGMGFQKEAIINVFHAAALHDIGLIGADNRIKVLHLGQMEAASGHSEVGFELLRHNPLFSSAAEIIRYHHAVWGDGRGAQRNGLPVPLGSHILALADAAERMIDRGLNVLEQTEFIVSKIASLSGPHFHPECVEAFCDVARTEAFWLDAAYPRVYSVLLRQVDWPSLAIDEVAVGPIAEIFGRIVDCASRWTMVHTAGVTATAVAVAERLNFSARELHLMRAAANLHDLGKLTVPAQVLDKPGKLTPSEMAIVRGHPYHTFRILDTIGGMPQICEWAAFHHERLDGNGYPFHHAGKDLTLGSRIMAVADVFTAVSEERPYRNGMSSEESLAVLEKLAADGGLDGDVVAIVKRNYDAIDGARRQEQARYKQGQQRMAELIKGQHVADVSSFEVP